MITHIEYKGLIIEKYDAIHDFEFMVIHVLLSLVILTHCFEAFYWPVNFERSDKEDET